MRIWNRGCIGSNTYDSLVQRLNSLSMRYPFAILGLLKYFFFAKSRHDQKKALQGAVGWGLFPTVLYKSLNSNASMPPSGISPMIRAG